jgi:arabinogalactan endo-1,4-beta-galactosidase
MKVPFVTFCVVMILAAPAWAAEPAESQKPVDPGKATAQPGYTSYYTGQIKAIGKGTLDLHVLRGHSGIIHPVNVDEKTVVVLLDGKSEKLSDLKVGQWIKVYWNPDPIDPKQQRIVKIEPGMPWWVAERLADLEKNVGTLEITLMVFIGQIEQDGNVIRQRGPGDMEELHLVGPDHPGGYKEPFQARLQKEDMGKLLRHLAVEGFLADTLGDGQKDAALKPPSTPYLKLSAGPFYAYLPWGPDTIKRLKTMIAVVGKEAGEKIEGLLATAEKQIAAIGGAKAKPVDPPQAADRPNYTRYYIHAIGDGTLLVHSCLTPTRFSVKTDEKTAVIGMDSKAGTISDLRIGQWVKFRWEGSGNAPESRRIAVIEIVSDSLQGTIIAAPHEDGLFNIQPQGTKAPCAAMNITTDPKTVVSIAEEKVKVADLKVGMWMRAEMVGDVATRIVAGHLWIEEGERLVLFKGLPEEFFTHPAGFDVNNVLTKFGPLRMMYRLTGNGSYLRWGRKALPKEGMVVCWPTSLKARFSFGQPVKPDDHGQIHLPADVSELRIWFVDPIVPTKDDGDTRSRKVVSSFILGADISWVQQQEDEGVCFTDHGNLEDLLAILKGHGFNWIRLRVFCNPKAEKGYSKAGYCDLDHTLAMAKRIKAAGMRFLLDFHYSDTWADPGHQFKPAAWANLHGADLERAVHDHTRDVVAALKHQSTPPDMVQIGNEISNGFLWPDGNVWKSGKWDVFCGLLKAGIAGAREAYPSVKIMLHLAWGGQNAQSKSFLDKALAQGVEFDIIGQSYYPKWHGTLDDLRANLMDLAARYKQNIIVVEYSVPNVRQINDIVHGLPGGKGLGTFIWEPTKWEGPALFDGNGSTKPEINVYPELAKEYGNQ